MGLLIGIGATKPAFPYDHYYGIEWDDAVAVSSATRIGRPELHAELPVHSRMKRCLLNDQGQVTAYLDPTNSTQLEGGGAAILDGSQGQVLAHDNAGLQGVIAGIGGGEYAAFYHFICLSTL
jgi:hypothetical protein